MAVGEALIMASKFRGCLLGTLLGDCLGAPYEGDTEVSKVVLQGYFDKLCGPYFPAPVKQYTDDSAMTLSVANSLLHKQGFDPEDMAKRFVKEFFRQPNRGYGGSVTDVFAKLRASRFADVYAPAREQFGGMGSFGNGGAMRVAPVALFYHDHTEGLQHMLDTARRVTELTHTHRDACNGAVLQCMAISQSLQLDPREPVDGKAFLAGLQAKMARVERDEEGLGLDEAAPYQKALTHAQKLLAKPVVLDAQVENYLGTDISALRSVPTAIFCFLRAQQQCQMEGIECEDPFRRTLQYAISLGGDTDTIASMAGALAGAFLGKEAIKESLLKHCEASTELSDLGQRIFAARSL